jgi:two-component system, sensor histidine kinase and response regulator
MDIQSSSTILIVDDSAVSTTLLSNFFTMNDFKVLVERSGEEALQFMNSTSSKPDLILLDVMMPGISGFETCKQLKANSKTQEIPIIFMTSLSDTGDKIKAFELGAVDYVTKPFQQEEVLARINTHLILCRLQQQLIAKNAELEAQHTLALQLNAQLQHQNKELETQYRLTQELNLKLQKEIRERKKAEQELENAKLELSIFGNFSKMSAQ